VVLYDATDRAVDTSGVGSSVRLAPTPLVGGVALNWQAEVPWSNNTEGYPYHYIYRNRVPGHDESALVLIDSVDVNMNGFRYTDDGSVTGEGPLSDLLVYCYYVTTQGSYGNEKIVAPLLNNSQVVCTQPNDTIPPCAPMAVSIPNAEISDCEAFLSHKACDFDDFANTVIWSRDPSDCDEDVGGYNIYFSYTGAEDSFEKIATVSDTFYVDGPLSSFAGCYKVSAMDRSGNESGLSEMVCNDNCPNYELPNVFTPNADGSNDVFRAFDNPRTKCPRFVESVKFIVYNRWGKEVYSYESGGERSIFINWDGRTNEGELVAAGLYYYTADVKFVYLDPNRGHRQFKDWVQVLYLDEP
jgi:gliding motility-associated-like protein